MQKKLYLMRHGETLFNLLNKVQGASDSPLTEKGIKQAEAAKQYFEHHQLTFDHAYSSTQERAVDTLEIATGNKIPYTRLKELKEMNFGLYEAEFAHLQPKGPDSFEHFYADYGGETASEVRDRIYSKLFEIMSRPDHENVLAVSHNGAIYFFLQSIWKDEHGEIPLRLANGGFLVLEFDRAAFTLKNTINPFEELETRSNNDGQ